MDAMAPMRNKCDLSLVNDRSPSYSRITFLGAGITMFPQSSCFPSAGLSPRASLNKLLALGRCRGAVQHRKDRRKITADEIGRLEPKPGEDSAAERAVGFRGQ